MYVCVDIYIYIYIRLFVCRLDRAAEPKYPTLYLVHTPEVCNSHTLRTCRKKIEGTPRISVNLRDASSNSSIVRCARSFLVSDWRKTSGDAISCLVAQQKASIYSRTHHATSCRQRAAIQNGAATDKALKEAYAKGD